MEKVFKKVLNKIIPTSKERTDLSDVLKNVINATESVIGPLGLTKTVAGSFIRDTWLADKKEVDLFILFPVTYSRERLEKVG
ncbi:MAG: hypothetical protein KAS04_05540, partial [Candidatus Aenigmarchaeota archaeon]|nr:hypothetical protein [Candidatus Aenigmarchaeota archaeon]